MVDLSKYCRIDLRLLFISHLAITKLTLCLIEETGSLFALICDLMVSHTPGPVDHAIQDDLKRVTTSLGRYFQIRDDYQNLVSTDVRCLSLLHKVANDDYANMLKRCKVSRQEGLLRGPR